MKKKTIEAVVTKLADDGHDCYVLEEIYTIIKAYKQVKRQKKKDKEVPQRIGNWVVATDNRDGLVTKGRHYLIIGTPVAKTSLISIICDNGEKGVFDTERLFTILEP